MRRNYLKTGLFFFLLIQFIFTGCNNLIDNSSSETKSAESQYGYISIGTVTSAARGAGTLYPSGDDIKVSNLTNISLSGKWEGGASKTIVEECSTWSTFNSSTNFPKAIQTGSWVFTLQATYNSKIFTANCIETIESGTTKTLTFELELDESEPQYGGLSITVNITSGSATSVIATLKKSGSAGAGTTDTLIPSSGAVTYTKNLANTSQRIEAGLYDLSFAFKSEDSDASYSETLSTLPLQVRIVSGLTTTASIDWDLNTVYTIEYNVNGGSPAPGQVMQKMYSKATGALTLPIMEKEGFAFDGWYENSGFTGSRVTTIPATAREPKEYFARYIDTLYIKDGGAEYSTSSDGTRDTAPLDSIASAVSKLKEYEAAGANWKIEVEGTITGNQTLSEVSSTYATSITIQKKTGESDNGVLDANNSGTALTIENSVPVTITNITIQNASQTGLHIGTGTSVTIATGTKITGNIGPTFQAALTRAGGIFNEGSLLMTDGEIYNNGIGATNLYGAGVYNLGTFEMSGGKIYGNSGNTGAGVYVGGTNSKFYMNGSAVIGNKTATGYATSTEKSNYATKMGGGLYVDYTGTASIGYKSDDSIDDSFTGGIFYNYADQKGGAILAHGTINISGTIKNNGATDGGSVYVVKSSGILGRLNLNGKAYIPSSGTAGENDIYIEATNSAVVTIAGELTPPEACTDGIVARITSDSYDTDTQIITVATTPSPATSIANEYEKFDINSSTKELNNLGKPDDCELLVTVSGTDYYKLNLAYDALYNANGENIPVVLGPGTTAKKLGRTSNAGTILKAISANHYGQTSNKTSFDITVADGVSISLPEDSTGFFASLSRLNSIDLTNFSTAGVKNMKSMFNATDNIRSLDLSSFDTSQVENMALMFCGCTKLDTLNIRSFNTANVTTMKDMFQQCECLKKLDLSHFNTSNVQIFNCMFEDCDKLEFLDLRNFDTSSGTDFFHMFYLSSKLKMILANSNFDCSNETVTSNMFDGCTSLVGGAGTSFDSSNKDSNYARIDGGPASATPGYFTSPYYITLNGTSYDTLAASLDAIDLATGNVEIVLGPLVDADALGSNATTATNTLCYKISHNTTADSISLSIAPGVTITLKENSEQLFYQADAKIVSLDLRGFDTSGVKKFNNMFKNLTSLTHIDLSTFDTRNATTFESMFQACTALTELDLSSFVTSTNLTTVSYMFYNCNKLTTIYATDAFDTSHITSQYTAASMFALCSSLEGGNGTTFNSEIINNTYARIDGGPSSATPGYFTTKP